jgi:hypothetical protein
VRFGWVASPRHPGDGVQLVLALEDETGKAVTFAATPERPAGADLVVASGLGSTISGNAKELLHRELVGSAGKQVLHGRLSLRSDGGQAAETPWVLDGEPEVAMEADVPAARYVRISECRVDVEHEHTDRVRASGAMALLTWGVSTIVSNPWAEARPDLHWAFMVNDAVVHGSSTRSNRYSARWREPMDPVRVTALDKIHLCVFDADFSDSESLGCLKIGLDALETALRTNRALSFGAVRSLRCRGTVSEKPPAERRTARTRREARPARLMRAPVLAGPSTRSSLALGAAQGLRGKERRF